MLRSLAVTEFRTESLDLLTPSRVSPSAGFSRLVSLLFASDAALGLPSHDKFPLQSIPTHELRHIRCIASSAHSCVYSCSNSVQHADIVVKVRSQLDPQHKRESQFLTSHSSLSFPRLLWVSDSFGMIAISPQGSSGFLFCLVFEILLFLFASFQVLRSLI